MNAMFPAVFENTLLDLFSPLTSTRLLEDLVKVFKSIFIGRPRSGLNGILHIDFLLSFFDINDSLGVSEHGLLEFDEVHKTVQ